MTETENLKHEAYKSLVASRMNELFDYMQAMLNRGKEERAFLTRDMVFTNLLLLAWWIVIMSNWWITNVEWLSAVNDFAILSYFLKVWHGWYFCLTPLMKTNSELDGCFNTLYILGFMEKRNEDCYREYKSKESVYEKMWTKVQNFLKGKAYA